MADNFRIASIVLAFLLVSLAVWYLHGQLYSLTVNRYTVPVTGLPYQFEGFTLLHLSDLHNKEFGEQQKQLLAVINKQDFDMVVITGDLINRKRPYTKPVLDLLAGIHKPVFFVPGNHEWETAASVREEVLSSPAVLLQNRAEKVVRGNGHIWIAGVDDQNSKRDRLQQALKTIDDAPVVLLAHQPGIFKRAANTGVDLVLSGHTHGGQVRLPFIGALYAPDQGWFPLYEEGLYISGSSSMIINSGLGESLLPLRFNNPPEIVLVTLTAKK